MAKSDSDSSKLFRPINQSIGQQPSLGPIPSSLMAPSGGILVGFYLLIEVLLSLGFVVFLLLSIWGISTWWVAVGEKTWKFTHKFSRVPHWKRGHVHYHGHLGQHDE